ncbi:hypothetical protein FF1_038938 [Malus domestica]
MQCFAVGQLQQVAQSLRDSGIQMIKLTDDDVGGGKVEGDLSVKNLKIKLHLRTVLECSLLLHDGCCTTSTTVSQSFLDGNGY